MRILFLALLCSAAAVEAQSVDPLPILEAAYRHIAPKLPPAGVVLEVNLRADLGIAIDRRVGSELARRVGARMGQRSEFLRCETLKSMSVASRLEPNCALRGAALVNVALVEVSEDAATVEVTWLLATDPQREVSALVDVRLTKDGWKAVNGGTAGLRD